MVGGRLPKSSTKTPIQMWWIAKALKSYHLWGYHNYPWDWAQTQVNTSVDTTSMLTITTLVMYDKKSTRCERRSYAKVRYNYTNHT